MSVHSLGMNVDSLFSMKNRLRRNLAKESSLTLNMKGEIAINGSLVSFCRNRGGELVNFGSGIVNSDSLLFCLGQSFTAYIVGHKNKTGHPAAERGHEGFRCGVHARALRV